MEGEQQEDGLGPDLQQYDASLPVAQQRYSRVLLTAAADGEQPQVSTNDASPLKPKSPAPPPHPHPQQLHEHSVELNGDDYELTVQIREEYRIKYGSQGNEEEEEDGKGAEEGGGAAQQQQQELASAAPPRDGAAAVASASNSRRNSCHLQVPAAAAPASTASPRHTRSARATEEPTAAALPPSHRLSRLNRATGDSYAGPGPAGLADVAWRYDVAPEAAAGNSPSNSYLETRYGDSPSTSAATAAALATAAAAASPEAVAEGTSAGAATCAVGAGSSSLVADLLAGISDGASSPPPTAAAEAAAGHRQHQAVLAASTHLDDAVALPGMLPVRCSPALRSAVSKAYRRAYSLSPAGGRWTRSPTDASAAGRPSAAAADRSSPRNLQLAGSPLTPDGRAAAQAAPQPQPSGPLRYVYDLMEEVALMTTTLRARGLLSEEDEDDVNDQLLAGAVAAAQEQQQQQQALQGQDVDPSHRTDGLPPDSYDWADSRPLPRASGGVNASAAAPSAAATAAPTASGGSGFDLRYNPSYRMGAANAMPAAATAAPAADAPAAVRPSLTGAHQSSWSWAESDEPAIPVTAAQRFAPLSAMKAPQPQLQQQALATTLPRAATTPAAAKQAAPLPPLQQHLAPVRPASLQRPPGAAAEEDAPPLIAGVYCLGLPIRLSPQRRRTTASPSKQQAANSATKSDAASLSNGSPLRSPPASRLSPSPSAAKSAAAAVAGGADGKSATSSPSQEAAAVGFARLVDLMACVVQHLGGMVEEAAAGGRDVVDEDDVEGLERLMADVSNVVAEMPPRQPRHVAPPHRMPGQQAAAEAVARAGSELMCQLGLHCEAWDAAVMEVGAGAAGESPAAEPPPSSPAHHAPSPRAFNPLPEPVQAARASPAKMSVSSALAPPPADRAAAPLPFTLRHQYLEPQASPRQGALTHAPAPAPTPAPEQPQQATQPGFDGAHTGVKAAGGTGKTTPDSHTGGSGGRFIDKLLKPFGSQRGGSSAAAAAAAVASGQQQQQQQARRGARGLSLEASPKPATPNVPVHLRPVQDGPFNVQPPLSGQQPLAVPHPELASVPEKIDAFERRVSNRSDSQSSAGVSGGAAAAFNTPAGSSRQQAAQRPHAGGARQNGGGSDAAAAAAGPAAPGAICEKRESPVLLPPFAPGAAVQRSSDSTSLQYHNPAFHPQPGHGHGGGSAGGLQQPAQPGPLSSPLRGRLLAERAVSGGGSPGRQAGSRSHTPSRLSYAAVLPPDHHQAVGASSASVEAPSSAEALKMLRRLAISPGHDHWPVRHADGSGSGAAAAGGVAEQQQTPLALGTESQEQQQQQKTLSRWQETTSAERLLHEPKSVSQLMKERQQLEEDLGRGQRTLAAAAAAAAAAAQAAEALSRSAGGALDDDLAPHSPRLFPLGADGGGPLGFVPFRSSRQQHEAPAAVAALPLEPVSPKDDVGVAAWQETADALDRLGLDYAPLRLSDLTSSLYTDPGAGNGIAGGLRRDPHGSSASGYGAPAGSGVAAAAASFLPGLDDLLSSLHKKKAELDNEAAMDSIMRQLAQAAAQPDGMAAAADRDGRDQRPALDPSSPFAAALTPLKSSALLQAAALDGAAVPSPAPGQPEYTPFTRLNSVGGGGGSSSGLHQPRVSSKYGDDTVAALLNVGKRPSFGRSMSGAELEAWNAKRAALKAQQVQKTQDEIVNRELQSAVDATNKLLHSMVQLPSRLASAEPSPSASPAPKRAKPATTTTTTQQHHLQQRPQPSVIDYRSLDERALDDVAAAQRRAAGYADAQRKLEEEQWRRQQQQLEDERRLQQQQLTQEEENDEEEDEDYAVQERQQLAAAADAYRRPSVTVAPAPSAGAPLPAHSPAPAAPSTHAWASPPTARKGALAVEDVLSPRSPRYYMPPASMSSRPLHQTLRTPQLPVSSAPTLAAGNFYPPSSLAGGGARPGAWTPSHGADATPAREELPQQQHVAPASTEQQGKKPKGFIPKLLRSLSTKRSRPQVERVASVNMTAAAVHLQRKGSAADGLTTLRTSESGFVVHKEDLAAAAAAAAPNQSPRMSPRPSMSSVPTAVSSGVMWQVVATSPLRQRPSPAVGSAKT